MNSSISGLIPLLLLLSCVSNQFVNAAIVSKDLSKPFGSLSSILKPLLPGGGVVNKPREDEDDPEFTTVKGPGHEGILAGLAGIFSGVVDGNLNRVVESSFQFVPKAHHPNVNKVYGSLVGRTEPTTTTTTERATRPPPPPRVPVGAANNEAVSENEVLPASNEEPANNNEEAEVEEGNKPTLRSKDEGDGEEEEPVPAPAAVNTANRRPRPPLRRPIQQSNPDDEEEEADFEQRRPVRPNIRYRPRNPVRPKPTPPVEPAGAAAENEDY